MLDTVKELASTAYTPLSASAELAPYSNPIARNSHCLAGPDTPSGTAPNKQMKIAMRTQPRHSVDRAP